MCVDTRASRLNHLPSCSVSLPLPLPGSSLVQTHQFMTMFLATQAMLQFCIERVVRAADEYEVLYFDELIKSRKNRSVSRSLFQFKDTTPFLNVRASH